MKTALSKRQQIGLLFFLTILLVIVSARVELLHSLAFIAFLPLAFMLPKLNIKQALGLTTLCATLFWMGTSYWLVGANISFANSAFFAVALVFVLFCLWQALPYTLLVWAYSYFDWKNHALGPFYAAAALTLAWVILPSPLPWLPINSLYVYPKFVAVLDLSGISLLLFLSTLFCFSLEYSCRKTAPYKKAYIALLVIIPIAMLAYGQLRQAQLDAAKVQAETAQWLRIGYIQPSLKYEETFDRAYVVTEQLIQKDAPDLIVWPEIASPYSFIESYADRSNTLNLVKKYQQDLITVSGYVYSEPRVHGQPRHYYNQAQLIKDGRMQGQYSKEILVPFFEYLPKPLSFLRQWMPRVLYYQAGENQQPLSYRENITLIMAICYEVIFPEYIRKQVKQGGNLLINPSSDAAFGGGIGGYYHLATAYFRSIENRVPWVRATNTGISIIVDADGKPLTPASENHAISSNSAHVYIPTQTSFYSQTGDWFSKILIVLSTIFLVMNRKKLLRHTEKAYAPNLKQKTKTSAKKKRARKKKGK